MLSSVLNSSRAISINIQIIRIFTRIREVVLTNKDVLIKLGQIEKKSLKQDKGIKKHEDEIQFVFNALKQLLAPPPLPNKKIGVNVKIQV